MHSNLAGIGINALLYLSGVGQWAPHSSLFIHAVLCKGECLEHVLQVDAETNEVQCQLGAFMTALHWQRQHYPGWRVKEASCVRTRETAL